MAIRPSILIASPHVAECAAIADWLSSEGFDPIRATTVAGATQQLNDRTFELLVSDFDFAVRGGLHATARERMRNPKAAAVLIGELNPAYEAQAEKRGAMYVARPLDQAAVVCAVHMGVMESRPERRSLRKRVNRFDAIVGGVPSHIIDVSNEGLRLEIPRSRNAAPPTPVFAVRVPIVGVSLIVRRMWTRNLPDRGFDAVWYGGELAGNAQRIELAWRTFVDTVPNAGVAIEYQ
jgi:ActR/RegA family two-component response regulator